MTRFKFWRSVGKSYKEQALIYGFCQCRNSPEVSERVRKKIKDLLLEAGGENAGPLEAYLCTDASWKWIITNYPISERTLYRVTAKFLTLW